MNPEKLRKRDPTPEEITAMCELIKKDREGRKTRSGMPTLNEDERIAGKRMYRLSIPNSNVRY